MRINQNIQAFNAYRNLDTTNSQLGKSLQKLSSGLEINKAADDASGLIKSESMRTEISGVRQAVQNAQDGVNFVQTAEGALSEVHAILQRIRVLAVDSANTATSNGVPQQAEVDALLAEIDAIGSRSSIAGVTIFKDYSVSAHTFQVGADPTLSNQLTLSTDLGLASNDVIGVDLSSISLGSNPAAALGTLDSAIESVSSARGSLGATQNRLEYTISNLQVAVENLSASESRVRDVDMALEMVAFTRHQIMSQAGTAMLAQANTTPQTVLSLLG